MSTFSEFEAAKYVRTIIQTIQHCHKNNIVHRDLKPDNIVLDRPGLGGILKIVDFGDALLIPNDDPKWATHSAIGTIYYVPPEIDEIRNGPTLKKGDMWSIGVITYLLVTGKFPFYGVDYADTLSRIIDGRFAWPDPKHVKLSGECRDFILCLLRKNPKKRLSAGQALKHMWLTKDASKSDLGKNVLKSLDEFVKAEVLKKILINFMKHDLLSEDSRKNMIAAFKVIDANGDGQLSKEEMLNYWKSKGLKQKDAAVRVRAAFKLMDPQKTGFISYENYVRSHAQSHANKNSRMFTHKSFGKLDSDNKGFVTQKQLVRTLSPHATKKEMKLLLKEIQSMKSEDGTISFDKFHKAVTGRPESTFDINNKANMDLQVALMKQKK